MRDRTLVNLKRLIVSLGMTLGLAFIASSSIQAQTPTCTVVVKDFATYTSCTGTFPDPTWYLGRPYDIEVPTNWNGTLVLIGQGYAYPGSPPPTSGMAGVEGSLDAESGDLAAQPWNFGQWLLHNGYATAGCWAGTGWAVKNALHYQILTLDTFTSMFGTPTRTIAYGASLGGIITAGLIQEHPERFAGALTLAGVLAGSVGVWNEGLDFAFAIQQLLDPTLQIVHITDPGTPTSGNFGRALQVVDAAQKTPQGRARIALVSAFLDLPGWFDPKTPEPAADDYATREFNQFQSAVGFVGLAFGLGRVDVEGRAGGNPSWNTGVNYEAQLEKSTSYAGVVALYQAAGLSLDEDLARLQAAPRISADPMAVERFSQGIVFDGELGGVPILTVHTTDDPVITSQNEFAYRSAVLAARDPQFLRQAYVHRAGHGMVSAAEIIAAFEALIRRIDTGKWEGSASPDALNAAALALGPSFNVLVYADGSTAPATPAYEDFGPAPFLRPYNLDDRKGEVKRGLRETHSAPSTGNGNRRVAPRPR